MNADKNLYFKCSMYYMRKYFGLREIILLSLLLAIGLALFIAWGVFFILILFGVCILVIGIAFALFLWTSISGYKVDFERLGIAKKVLHFGDESIEVRVTVTNTGDRPGVETVQLYIRDLVGSVTRPVKQLKGFRKLALEPGASADVTFTVDKETISFWRQDMTWGPEPGCFKVFVGGASDCVKEAEFEYI